MSQHKYLLKSGYLLKKDQLTSQQLKQVIKDLTVTPYVIKAYKSMAPPKSYPIYQESPNYLYVPRFYGIEKFGLPVKDKIPQGENLNDSVKFIFNMLPHQHTCFSKGVQAMNTIGGGILSVYCGFGKTAMGIKLAIEMKGKTLVVVNKEVLMDQWIDAITKFTGGLAKIGIIQQDKCDIEGKDFVVAMIHTLCLKEFPNGTFDSFRTCIFDECHHASSEMFSKSLPKANCKYMIGLSATPKRNDKTEFVFYNYLGPMFHTEKRTGSNRIIVKRFKLNPTIHNKSYQELMMANGVKNTTAMITNLSKCNSRNYLIGECIRQLMKEDRKILLLSGRREHLDAIYNYLQSANIVNYKGIPITYGFYWGSQGGNKTKHKQLLNQSAQCDVVLGTQAIASEGLDIPDLNTEILATPYADVEQSVGRILRRFHTKVCPIVIDFVDKLGNFPSQGNTRRKFYKTEDYDIQDMSLTLDEDTKCVTDQLPNINKYLADTKFSNDGDDNVEVEVEDEDEDEDNTKSPIKKLGKCMID